MCEAQHTALTSETLQTGFTLSVNGHLKPLPQQNILMIKYQNPLKSKRTRKEINSTIKRTQNINMQTKPQPVEHDSMFHVFSVLIISSQLKTNKKHPMVFDHKLNLFFFSSDLAKVSASISNLASQKVHNQTLNGNIYLNS